MKNLPATTIYSTEFEPDEVPAADDDALSLALSLDVVDAVSQAARRKAAEKIAIRRCTIFMPSICLPVPGFVVHSLTLLVNYGLLLSEAGDRLRKNCISKYAQYIIKRSTHKIKDTTKTITIIHVQMICM